MEKAKYNLMAFVIPKALQKEFQLSCWKKNASMSQIVRDLMEDFIKEVREDEQKNMA